MMRPRNLPYYMLYAWALACVPSWTAAQSPVFQPPEGVPTQPPQLTSALSDELWKSSRQVGSSNTGYNTQSSPQLANQPTNSNSSPAPAQVSNQSGLRPSAPARVGTSVQSNGPQNLGQSPNYGSVQHAVATQANSLPSNSPQSSVVQASAETSRTQSRTVLQPKSKSDESSSSKSNGGTAKMLVSIVSSLVLVIGLFLGVALLYRKSISTTLGKGLPKNVVQVLGKTTIAPRQQLVLVRFGSKLVLVSMLQGEARTLSEITDPLEVDQLAGFCESGQSGSMASSFREILVQGVKA